MPKHILTPKDGSKGGKKSRRKPFDIRLREYFDKYFEECEQKGDKRTRKEIMIEAGYKLFKDGNNRPLSYLMDRAFGKAKQPIEHSGEIEYKDTTIVIDGKIKNIK
jgi:hypothetical protein